VANFATGTSGDAASAYIAGNIGGDILKRFTVILDYAHQRLWLEPNALASAPEVFDRSGLWLSRASDGDISVGDVAHGSAAQSAGIEAGDEIVAVNGKPASRVRLYQLREALKGDPGTRFIFTVKQGGRLRAVQLLLKKQV
jgi:S1-C subfamily serine protease